MAGEGYFGGNPQTVYDTRVDLVLDAYDYAQFRSQYRETFLDMCRQEKENK